MGSCNSLRLYLINRVILILLHGTSPNTIHLNTSLEVNKGQGACCVEGIFWKSGSFDTFLKSEFGKELAETYGINLIYCGVTQLLGPEFFHDAETPCRCDCQYAHGASGYIYTCDLLKNDEIPCICEYHDGDVTIKPNSACGTNRDVPNSTEPGTFPGFGYFNATRQSTQNDMKEGEEGGVEDFCEFVLGNGRKLICDDIGPPDENFYLLTTGEKIFPQDVCSFDCYFIHGFRTNPPYGRCCATEDGIKYCVCV